MKRLLAVVGHQYFLFVVALCLGLYIAFAWRQNRSPIAESSSTSEAGRPMPATQLVEPTRDRSPIVRQDEQLVIETDADNNKIAAGHYKNGMRVAHWEFFYANGQLRGAGEFTNDTRVGPWRFYYPNGNVMSEGVYDENGRKKGKWVTFYSDGGHKMAGFYDKNIRVGQWRAWPYEGQPNYCWIGNFDAEGKKDGEWFWTVKNATRCVETWEHGVRKSVIRYGNDPILPDKASPAKTINFEATSSHQEYDHEVIGSSSQHSERQ